MLLQSSWTVAYIRWCDCFSRIKCETIEWKLGQRSRSLSVAHREISFAAYIWMPTMWELNLHFWRRFETIDLCGKKLSWLHLAWIETFKFSKLLDLHVSASFFDSTLLAYEFLSRVAEMLRNLMSMQTFQRNNCQMRRSQKNVFQMQMKKFFVFELSCRAKQFEKFFPWLVSIELASDTMKRVIK